MNAASVCSEDSIDYYIDTSVDTIDSCDLTSDCFSDDDSEKVCGASRKPRASLLAIFATFSNNPKLVDKALKKTNIDKWRSNLADQVASIELRNQFPPKRFYYLKMLNKFHFVEDVDFEAIFDDQNQTAETIETVFWLVELRLNGDMLHFYGQSKVKPDRALKNALIVALNFCTMKVVHEKVIPRHLKCKTQFLMHCFLDPEMEKGLKKWEKLPEVQIKRKVNHMLEQVAKRRKRTKSVCDEIDESNESCWKICDDSFVFEVNLKTDKMYFCLERNANDYIGALNKSLLHILKNKFSYSVV